MATKLKYRIGILAATLAAALAAPALEPGVALFLGAGDAGPYYPGLPIHLKLTVQNNGTRTVSIPEPTLSGRDNPYHSVQVFTGQPGQELAPVECVVPNFAPWKEGDPPVPPAPIALEPGASHEIAFSISYDWVPRKVKAIVAPGTLQIQAALCGYGDNGREIDRADRVLSNTLALSIEKPAGASAAAWSMAQKSERPWLLAWPSAVDHVRQGGDFRLFQEVAEAGDSTYSRHAAALVAHMYAKGNELDVAAGRPPLPLVASQWLEKAMAGVKDADRPSEWKTLAEQLGEHRESE